MSEPKKAWPVMSLGDRFIYNDIKYVFITKTSYAQARCATLNSLLSGSVVQFQQFDTSNSKGITFN